MKRPYTFIRIVKAGCVVCGGNKILWEGKNAQGVAVQHYDKYGHEVWVKIEMEIHYGDTGIIEAKPKQSDMFNGEEKISDTKRKHGRSDN